MNAEERARDLITHFFYDKPPPNLEAVITNCLTIHGESEYQNGNESGYQRGLRELKADIETNIKYAEGRGISMPWSREDIVKIIEKRMEVKS